MRKNKGFTLIELLVVIAIIGLLSTVVLVALSRARAKARDAKRLSDIRQILLALEMYYDVNNAYPSNTDNDCGGWDTGYNGGPGIDEPFLETLETGGFMSEVPGDPVSTGNCEGYAYFKYGAGAYNCDASRGAYIVVGVRDLETSSRPHPSSPGWSCPERSWISEFDWVTGRFEK